MLPSFLLTLREGLEIALILGIVLGALRKLQHKEFFPVVWVGAASAAVLSMLIAGVLNVFGATLEGPAEPVYEGITMLLAAGVLTWMIFWMHHQSRSIKSNLEAGVRQALIKTGKGAIFALAFVSVLREGIELALFFTAASLASDAHQALFGALGGFAVAALLGYALFASTVRLDLGLFFRVTGALLILFAAGLVAHGVHELNEVGWVPALVEHIWDTNFLVAETSFPGQVLKTLFGYNGNPSLTEVLAYLVYFAAIALGLRRSAAAMTAAQEA
jgi:high-affinity iron transporter